MLMLIKKGEVYTPSFIGKKDLLIAGGKIIAIEDQIDLNSLSIDVQVIDGEGFLVMPGFVDGHVHIIGGGGEGGFKTRTPELMISQATIAGVTTMVGVIGTDGTSRTMPDLIAKAKGLTEEGITCYVHIGSYQVPIQPLTDSLQSDLLLIDQIIGIGEVAISDHRSSQPTVEEISRLAAYARVGGMLSGKGGIVNVHVGDSKQTLSILNEVIDSTDIPITQFLPTHINRNAYLFDAGIQYAKKGGYIDFTTSTIPKFLGDGEVKCSQALKRALLAGVSIEQITFTSDAQGSLPDFDESGNLIGMQIGQVSSLFQEVRDAVLTEGVELETALKVITKNPASILNIPGKGELAVGNDGDVVLATKDLHIHSVIAKGQLMVEGGKPVVKGTFE
ncbi:isoaspartyl dipeptidase [Halalkalibacter wakoensis JCM 9140]|uniref:Isoaspartyl dipeptidase n=1 Tax=Halalkalibacter wakoensis JCM 9140 TaxID=1236970 RepID=W4Q2A4_9BACI|nr:beta-aspartyl-peptidase [Halalkalibacter wakoensis]GAE25858.1 isoaspartyl dipeptidase [Halalkalibacter wakoensis JCM 9140]